jgi:hypothetical protein
MKSYTYELPDPGRLLSLTRENLLKIGEEWRQIADFMLQGHVEYKPLRSNPMRAGFTYQRARLNLTLYFSEPIFNHFMEWMDAEKVEILKAVIQSSLPKRSGYDIHEFKIHGIIEDS